MYSGMLAANHSADNIIIDNRFLRKTNETFERYVFNMRKQRAHETIDDYIAALCSLASTCNFCDCLKDSLLRDRIVSGIKDSSTRKRLLQEADLNLETCIAMCRAAEAAAAAASSQPVKTLTWTEDTTAVLPEVFVNFSTELDDSDDDDSALPWTTEHQSSGFQWNRTERNLGPGCSMEEASAVYSTAQPMSDSASLLMPQDPTHPCYLCSAAFVLVSSLELHLASVHGEKLDIVLPGSSTPDRCDAADRKMTLNKAGDIGGRSLSRQLVCDLCSKSFLTPSRLKTHKLNNVCAKSFDCDECDMKFSAARSLTRHKKLHTGERPHKCPHCDHVYKTAGNLREHVTSVHEGAKPHLCDICGAAFPKVSNLTRHKRVHTGEKPHLCPFCGKGFSDSSTLRQHRYTHTGEKKVSCPHCPATFIYNVQLKRHMRKVHKFVS